MRPLLTVLLAGFIPLARSNCAKTPAVEVRCAPPAPPGILYLQALARQYHPEALAPAAQHDSMLVGFVFDSACSMLRHVTGRRSAGDRTVDDELARMFPDLSSTRFRMAGVADALSSQDPGRPFIVYAVLKQP